MIKPGMKISLLARFLSLICALAASVSFGAETRRPNILVLLADDLGYADVGFAGGKVIKTPNLDKLAAAGARLDDYYVQPLCSPTRAAFLTGRYPMRYGLQVGVLRPHEKRGLSTSERMLPQALKEAGYSTAIVGKWHLGHNLPEYLPLQRGFERQYGHYNGQIDYFTHEREGGFDWHRDDKVSRDEGYSTHLIAKEAVRLIEGYSPDKPFFLYVPFNGVHSPWQVPEKYKEPYRDLPEPRRTYAGMLAAMDEAVGQIHRALEQRGFARDTLIIFSSDNGGPAPGQITDNSPFRGGKGGVYEGGTRVCAFVTWESRIKAGTKIAVPMHAVDWYPTLTKLAGVRGAPPASLDGRDIWPVLAEGKTFSEREILLNTTPDMGAIRVGDWKLIVRRAGAAVTDSDGQRPAAKKKKASAAGESVELFNLAEDIGEKRNLTTENPAKAGELRKRLEMLASQAVTPGNQPVPAGYKSPAVWGER
jgi:arylsulfatase A-like enzyme